MKQVCTNNVNAGFARPGVFDLAVLLSIYQKSYTCWCPQFVVRSSRKCRITKHLKKMQKLIYSIRNILHCGSVFIPSEGCLQCWAKVLLPLSTMWETNNFILDSSNQTVSVIVTGTYLRHSRCLKKNAALIKYQSFQHPPSSCSVYCLSWQAWWASARGESWASSGIQRSLLMYLRVLVLDENREPAKGWRKLNGIKITETEEIIENSWERRK